ncbi:MAG: GntR family transcriptional regulator [Nitrososphaerales archaeon]
MTTSRSEGPDLTGFRKPVRSSSLRDRRPLYERAQATIIRSIAEGAYPPGSQLPPEDQLAASLGVSRTTIRSALGNLETLGYIERIHGAGTFVSQHRFTVEAQLDALESLHPRLAARLGLSSSLAGLTIEETPADAETARAMGIAAGSPVIRIARVVEFEGIPVAHLEDFLLPAMFGLEEIRAGFRDSLVDYFDGCDGRPLAAWTDSLLNAALAAGRLARLLKVHQNTTLFRLDEGFYTADGTLLLWSRVYVVPEHFRFHMRRRIVHGGS